MSLPSGFGPTERRERLFAFDLSLRNGVQLRGQHQHRPALDLRQPAQQPDRRLDGGADAGCLGIGAEAGERWYPG